MHIWAVLGRPACRVSPWVELPVRLLSHPHEAVHRGPLWDRRLSSVPLTEPHVKHSSPWLDEHVVRVWGHLAGDSVRAGIRYRPSPIEHTALLTKRSERPHRSHPTKPLGMLCLRPLGYRKTPHKLGAVQAWEIYTSQFWSVEAWGPLFPSSAQKSLCPQIPALRAGLFKYTSKCSPGANPLLLPCLSGEICSKFQTTDWNVNDRTGPICK